MASETTTTSDANRPACAAPPDWTALLSFMESERRRAQRGTLFAALIGGLAGAGAVLVALRGWPAIARSDGGTSGQLERRLDGVENSSSELMAQMRTLLSRPAAERAAPSDAAPVDAARSFRGDFGGKPSPQSLDAEERANRLGDDALARALEHARQLPVEEAADPASTIANEAGASARSPSATPAARNVKPPEEAKDAKSDDPAAATVAAFNGLLKDCGMIEWRLMSAEVAADDRSLKRIVLAHRATNGTADGSLTGDRLTLERDAATGVSAFIVSGARRTEGGVEEAFPNGTTRLEIPGVLPLDLLPPTLATLFGVAPNGAIGTSTHVDLDDPEQVVKEINRILALESGIAVRVRSCERYADGKLEHAVIDLLFDEHAAPRETVIADKAWFELDAKHAAAAVCCEGGEMIVDGARRPLFRGRLRRPLYSIAPLQWRGMPALKAVPGS